MNLNFKLKTEEINALGLTPEESLCYVSPFDIGEDGRLIRDGCLCVTELRVILLRGGKILRELPISEITEAKCEAQVNNGLVIVRTRENPEETVLCRVSMHHVSRMSWIMKGIMLLKKDRSRRVLSRDYERTCPVCGRAMRGRSECPKCSHRPSALLQFFKSWKPYRLRLIHILLVMAVVTALNLIQPEIQQIFIDRYLMTATGGMKAVLGFAVLMLAVNVLKIYTATRRYWLCSSMGAEIAMDFREKLYRKLQELSLSFINDRSAGALMNRVTRDTRTIRKFMEEVFSDMFSCLVTMIAASLIMLRMNWKMALLTILFVPLVLASSAAFHGKIHRIFHMQWTKMDKANNGLQDVLSGIRVVKSFGTEEEESENFKLLTEEYAKIAKRNETFFAVLFPLLSFFMSMGVYVATYFGGLNVLSGSMTVGELTQFISYAWILFGPLSWMTYLPRTLSELATGLERIYDVLDEEPAIRDSENAVTKALSGAVEFRDVTFGYRSYEPVLEHISLSVKPGEMIGLVGASGTGKSTMINLIMHLYEVDDGAIYVDGENINSLKLADYHAGLGVVLQENFLFAGTIYNNLRFSKPDATEEEIIRAAKMANAHDFILRTPDGYNTYIGEHGYSLSGGERQRLAIARAILNNPRILILDEATSALDTESEYLIQKALERLTKNCTTFAIAHRLSTLKDADRLIVIDGHRIAETGTHNELMEKKGIYYGLVTAQLTMQKLKEEEA